MSHPSKGFDLLPGDTICPWGHWLNTFTWNAMDSQWIWRAHVCVSVVFSNSPFTRYLLTCQNNASIQQHNKFSLFSLEEYPLSPSFTWINVTKEIFATIKKSQITVKRKLCLRLDLLSWMSALFKIVKLHFHVQKMVRQVAAKTDFSLHIFMLVSLEWWFKPDQPRLCSRYNSF